MKHEPTAGALRAAPAIQRKRRCSNSEILELLEGIIAEASDRIESRSPELVAQARAALRRYADGAPRQAE